MIMITTNEKLSGLHPAVSRPGRCLQELEFPMFSFKEAKEWYGPLFDFEDDVYSLASLYALKSQDESST